MKLFRTKFQKRHDVIAMENIIRALSDQPQIKTCISCMHLSSSKLDPNLKCNRDKKLDYNNVTGKKEIIGEQHYCNSERELESKLPNLVKSGQACGAIGQFWEENPKLVEISFIDWLTTYVKR